ncbi:MAG: protein-disulfide reductase DsbD domain-containing protein [Pseudomonadota bacterium]
MKFSTKLLLHLAAIVTFNGIAPANAGNETPWHNTLGGDVRILFESVAPTENGALPGSVRGAIEIKLQDGWHTYWRDPGASGIPPTFHLDEGSDIGQAAIYYPAPVWVDNNYGGYAGYTEPVLLPIMVDTRRDKSASFKGSLLLGICEEICIPVMLPFDVEITPSVGSSLNDVIIREAFAQLPAKAPQEAVDVDMSGKRFVVTLDQNEGAWTGYAIKSLFVHMDGAQLSNPKRIMNDQAALAFEAKINHIGGDETSRSLNIIAVADEMAFEVSTIIELTDQ